MSERRRRQRLEACLDTFLEGINGNYPARITDLSEGGCYIDSICDAYVGEQITFTVNMPDGTSLRLSGVIAHYVPRLGFGVQFNRLEPQVLERVKWLVTQLG